MRGDRVNWGEWCDFFSKRSDRPMPAPEANDLYLKLPKSLAESLAIFQLGESGGGTVVSQARHSNIKEIDARYADAMALLVEEEHRHADILASCVRTLGGTLIRRN